MVLEIEIKVTYGKWRKVFSLPTQQSFVFLKATQESQGRMDNQQMREEEAG